MKSKWGKLLLILLFLSTSQMVPVVASPAETTDSIGLHRAFTSPAYCVKFSQWLTRHPCKAAG